jgi:hypothetical protein
VKRRIALASSAESLVRSGLLGFVQSHGNSVQSMCDGGLVAINIQKYFQLGASNKFAKYCEKILAIQGESGSVPFAIEMLMTGAPSVLRRPQGGVGARKFAAAALLTFLLFAGFFATAQRAGADTGIPASGATGAVAVSAAGIPPGSTAVPPQTVGSGVPVAPVDLAQPVAQDAATAQAATGDAAAAQPQQSNGIGTTRTDSSGGESASQQNDVSVVGAAANEALTSQTADSGATTDGAAAEAAQQATTDQAADAAASAVQPQQSNVVIIVRINSPGDDVVSQTNVVSVVAVGANQSSTDQDAGPTGASAGATDPPQSPSRASSAPSTGGQPAQSSSAAQPQQSADGVQQLQPQGLRAVSVLAFSASSHAALPATENQATSPRTSAGRPRTGGAAGRSGVFGPNTAAAEGSPAARVDSDGSSVQTARSQGRKTGAQSSRVAALGAVRDHVANWLSRTGAAARPRLAADSAGGMSLGVLTLTALLVGLLGWAALSWSPFPRRRPPSSQR